MNLPFDQRPTVSPRTREEWRAWLEQNYASAPYIWLIYWKKSSMPGALTYEVAVEEALCFGWIDSKMNSIDETRSMQYFAPRKPKSTWSGVNKVRIERLIAEGRMTPAGMAKIDAARQDGSWYTLDAIEALVLPEDFAAALAANPTAQQHYTAFPPSTQKQILFWITSAKRPETRAKRVEETIRLAEQNIRARG